jgi:hyperosmotically inducible protein
MYDSVLKNAWDPGIVPASRVAHTSAAADPAVKSADIVVVTSKGEVQLSGFVDSQTQIDRALMVARGVEGTQSVVNQLNIKK